MSYSDFVTYLPIRPQSSSPEVMIDFYYICYSEPT